jgi:hypothetical protein
MTPPRYCESCGGIIPPSSPYVMMDITGREGPANDPVHIECFVAKCDVDLPSNDEIACAVVEYGARFRRYTDD